MGIELGNFENKDSLPKTFVVIRVFKAPRSKVFEVFTQPRTSGSLVGAKALHDAPV
jgi:uncharacterized protein YndB with AHSA1/START domain